uniref:Uncharacterized protein n=1 Tax=Anguilla anguilla TaxID=7936 RepID=A0A0E9U6P5_ANGAN
MQMLLETQRDSN